MLMLDVAIALSLVYLMMAGLVSGIQEALAIFLQQRGKMLRKGIESLLCGAVSMTGNDTSLLEKVYKHPMIDVLRDGQRLPSYVPASSFVLAFVDTLVDGYRCAQPLFAGLPEAVEKLPEGDLKRSLRVIIQQANGDVGKLQSLLEAHFNAVMDRVTGWYKRQTHWVLFLVAAVLSVAFNVDSVHLGQQLVTNNELRNRLVASADQVVKEGTQQIAPNAPAPVSGDPLNEKLDEVSKLLTDFRKLNLPIGWKDCNPSAAKSNPQQESKNPTPGKPDGVPPAPAGKNADAQSAAASVEMCTPNGAPSTVSSWLLVMGGWFVTAVAASLGAPFWFQMLSKLIPIRSAGVKPGTESAPGATGQAQVSPVTVVVPPAASPAGGPGSTTPPVVGPRNDFEKSRLTENDIIHLQRALGLADDKLSAVLDEATRSALKAWQQARGQPASGEFDETAVMAILYPQT